nr:UBN2 domain-containing protein [Tanacetum cinerariifolium]
MYCRGKENEIYILQLIDHGLFELGTTRDTLGTTQKRGVLLGPERPRTYDDLNDNEKKRFDADVRATNILLQGLPKDIYKLINHNTEAKAIWDNVKMFLAGSELTKEDKESQLYDEFERFKMLSSENINEYYVWFHKLVNDMRNIRMTMPNIQLNSKGDRIRLRGTLLGEMVDKCDAFDSDVDDEPTAQSIFMANLSSAGPTNQQAGPSNASILSEVHDLENTIDPCDDNQDEHAFHNEKRFDADVRATNILLQGLPKDIYKLINHNTEAKAIWDNVKMFLAGSELTKEDRESQLYDEFEHFKMLSSENINEYYVWFHKLVNDIRNIRMTMPNIQLNSKFVNKMSPE